MKVLKFESEKTRHDLWHVKCSAELELAPHASPMLLATTDRRKNHLGVCMSLSLMSEGGVSEEFEADDAIEYAAILADVPVDVASFLVVENSLEEMMNTVVETLINATADVEFELGNVEFHDEGNIIEDVIVRISRRGWATTISIPWEKAQHYFTAKPKEG